MTLARRIGTYITGIAVGVIFAAVIANFVGSLFPNARAIVFVVLVIIWLLGFVQILIRDIRTGDNARGVFARPEEWCAEELPREFRFITRDTTLQEIVDRVGPYTRLPETHLVRYDLPCGGAILIYPEPPFTLLSKVRGVQFYRTEADVPVFP
jgi:hypothetical protein